MHFGLNQGQIESKIFFDIDGIISSKFEIELRTTLLNPQAPAAQKIADEVLFGRFQGQGVEFF